MPDFNQPYPVSNAEHGKFVPMTQHELLTLGQDTSASDGRYAILTYDIGRVNGTVPVSFGDTPSVDAFGRVRMSQPQTIFDSKQLTDKQPLYWDEVSNGIASAHYLSGQSSTLMSVSADGDYSIRQTKMRFNYQPGKSQFIFFTGTFYNGVANVNKKLGYYNSSTVAPYATGLDGIYFEHDGINFKVGISNNGVTNTVAQSAWSYDQMDGTGPSQQTLDISKSQIFYMDFEWLGSGRVKMGFVMNGQLYRIHEFNHANILDGVYMASSNHSLRYEIRSTGGASHLKHICSSVMSEGGVELTGVTRSISNGGTVVAIGTTPEALIGMRLKTTHLTQTIIPFGISVVNTGTDDVRWFLAINPTFDNSGSIVWTDVANSAIQQGIPTGAQTVASSGTIVAGGYIAGGEGSGQVNIQSALRIGVSIAGVVDQLWLCIQNVAVAGSGNYLGAINFRQLL